MRRRRHLVMAVLLIVLSLGRACWVPTMGIAAGPLFGSHPIVQA